jgi:hypothetical protein
MIVRAESLWQGEELKGWRVCVEFGGSEECFETRQLFVDGELEREPPYSVYFFEAVEVRVSEDEVEIIRA